MLGIAGAPGAGKSTLAGLLVERISTSSGRWRRWCRWTASISPRSSSQRLGRASRKGAPDTFDVHGYIALLDRLHAELAETVYAPAFRRDLEEPIAGAIPVAARRAAGRDGGQLPARRHAPVGPAAGRASTRSGTWSSTTQVRLSRLVARHIAFGRSPDEARQWALVVDQPNADRVAQGRARADVVVRGV